MRTRTVVFVLALALFAAALCGAEEQLPGITPLRASIAKAIDKAADRAVLELSNLENGKLGERTKEETSSFWPPAPWRKEFWTTTNTIVFTSNFGVAVWDVLETRDNLNDGLVTFENPDHPGWIAADRFREGNFFGKLVIPPGAHVAIPAFAVTEVVGTWLADLLRRIGADLMRNNHPVIRALGATLYAGGYALPAYGVYVQGREAYKNHRWPR